MRRSLALSALVLGVGGSAMCDGADQPLFGTKLLLQKTPTREKLVLVLKDPAMLFPAIGSGDDPGTGTPGGAAIEIFPANEAAATLTIPRGRASPAGRRKRRRTPSTSTSMERRQTGRPS